MSFFEKCHFLSKPASVSYFKNGPFPATFSLFLSFQCSWQVTMFNVNFCRWLDSNLRPGIGSNCLPTEPQPLLTLVYLRQLYENLANFNSSSGSHWSQDLCFRRSRVERNSEGIRSPTQPCLGQQDWVPVRPGRCLQVDQEYPKAWTGGLLRSCRCCHLPTRWHGGHRQPVHPARIKMLA